jgi:Na+-transporting NADH:ubiquinone oxidoreductase subunit NqrF
VPQAQRALQPLDGSPARPANSAAGLPPIRSRSATAAFHLNVACMPAAVPARARNGVPFPRGEQSERRHLHQGTGARAGGRGRGIAFTPGDYLQLDIPATIEIRFRDFDIPEPFAPCGGSSTSSIWWPATRSPAAATTTRWPATSKTERQLRFNVRIATPPPGQDCAPGVGSSLRIQPQAGDIVTAIGPFGDFHIKPTSTKWCTSAAARAWLRCARTFRTCWRPREARKISFWYGARSRQEIFYEDYFRALAAQPSEFFLPPRALVAAARATTGPGTRVSSTRWCWKIPARASNPEAAEYYLCGPPHDDQGLHADARVDWSFRAADRLRRI